MSITPPNGRSSVMALAPKYARLRAVLENSAKNVEGGAKTAHSEVADLQRRAIASVQECAEIALRLAECLGDAACPRDITCLHLGDWNRCDACFNEQVSQFFDQASKFTTAIAASAEPGPNALRKAAVDHPGPTVRGRYRHAWTPPGFCYRFKPSAADPTSSTGC